MDKSYAETVRLMLTVAPLVFANHHFAMKGGTAINLFCRKMPRLSVDIDVAYRSWTDSRDRALQTIDQTLTLIIANNKLPGIGFRKQTSSLETPKLIIENEMAQVKIEVNTVFRGTVLPVVERPLNQKTSDLFGVAFSLPVLAEDELYGSKLVAALDRQHPRDLFDIWHLLHVGQINETMLECFVIYLSGHNRPTHEVLFGNDKELSNVYNTAFVGLTDMSCSLQTFLDTRAWLREELPKLISSAHREFLIGLSLAKPDWTLLRCTHASNLPALRWKLANLEVLKKRDPKRFYVQAEVLKDLLTSSNH